MLRSSAWSGFADLVLAGGCDLRQCGEMSRIVDSLILAVCSSDVYCREIRGDVCSLILFGCVEVRLMSNCVGRTVRLVCSGVIH